MSNALNPEAATAQNDAEIFGLLASFYNINPEASIVTAMRELRPEDIADNEVAEALEKIKSYAVGFDERNEGSILAVKKDWTKLFRGLSPTYGPKAPYEELYLQQKDANFLKQLTDLYLDSGYTTYTELMNRQDYIGTQLEFIGVLASFRQYAAENEDLDRHEKLTALADNFMNNHLKPWFREFHAEAQKYVSTDFYRGVLDFTLLMAS